MIAFAGVDGGQTSTVAAIGDAAGVEIARASGPPADLVGEPRDSARQVDAIRTAVAAALAKAGLDPGVRLAGLVAGISGFDRGVSLEPGLEILADRVAMRHDAEIAHAGAFAGAAGIVTIAGTGSVALGNAPPGAAFVRAGGWGYFFGDEGSAMWIARVALRRAMTAADRGRSCELADAARAFFGAFSLRAIQHAFAHGDIARPALAAFAGDVLALASAGDAEAGAIRAEACRELADLVAVVDARLAPGERPGRRVSYAGGLFADAPFAQGFRAAVLERLPQARVLPPESDPAAGALLLATQLPAAAHP